MSRPQPSLSVAQELVGLLERSFAGGAAPSIRALHLPPASAADSRSGEFCAIELDDGAMGLSFVLLEGTLAGLIEGAYALPLAGTDALVIARWYASETGVRRTLGFAAINALTRSLFDRTGFRPGPSTDSIGMLDPRPGEHIGMIGFFPPLVDRIAQTGARLTVAELNPALATDTGAYRVTLDASELSDCGKVLSTSTVLLNDSLDRMLATCSGAHAFAMIGPGAGCLPDPLFARGVTLVGGSWIEDGPAFADALRRGEPWGSHARKFALPAADYPGADALLARRR